NNNNNNNNNNNSGTSGPVNTNEGGRDLKSENTNIVNYHDGNIIPDVSPFYQNNCYHIVEIITGYVVEYSNNLSSWNLVESIIFCAQSNTNNPLIDEAISDSRKFIDNAVESEVKVVRSSLMLELAKVKQKLTILESKIKYLEDENTAFRFYFKEAQPLSFYAKKGDSKFKGRNRSASFTSIVNNKANYTNTTVSTSTSSSISTTNSLNNNTSSNSLSNVHPERIKNIILPEAQKTSAVENKSVVLDNKDNKDNKDSKVNIDRNTIAIYGLHCSSEDCSGSWIMKFFAESGISNNDIDVNNVRIYKPKKGKDFILVSLKNENDVQKILSNKSKLKNTKWNNVFIKRWVSRIQNIFNHYRNGMEKFSRNGNNVNGSTLNRQGIIRPAPPYLLLPSPYIPTPQYQSKPYLPHQPSLMSSHQYQQQPYFPHQPPLIPSHQYHQQHPYFPHQTHPRIMDNRYSWWVR
ncbi:MAG: hypothetical protein M3Y25_09235, partial [Thermoproteota archaeon]|nr:hypothetical protein [Thermoproteota archaeon]